MNKKGKIRLAVICCIFLIYIFGTLFIMGAGEQSENEIGYEFLDDGKVVHIWNTQDDYYFNKSSGIQFTNHYQDYWTRNVFCLGYYDEGTWNKIHCADELSNFNRDIQSDNSTYVNATLWKDIEYGAYDLRFGVNYYLGLDDEDLSVTVYGKNIGIDIPFDLGFAWKIKDWEIPPNFESDDIRLNGSVYELDGTFDLLFKNMTSTFEKYEQNETTGEIYSTGIVTEALPFFAGYDKGQFLRVDWNENLDYAVKMVGNGNQEDFYVALLINAGHFNPNQEKSTTFHWIDAGNDEYTKLLLHADGVNASSTFTDDSASAPQHNVTGNGSAVIDTTYSVFGGASASLVSTSFLSTDNHVDWDIGVGDFAIDFRIRWRNVGGANIFGSWAPLNYKQEAGNQVHLYLDALKHDFGDWTPNANQWYHIAFTRDGTDLRMFIDGTKWGLNFSCNKDIVFAGEEFTIGADHIGGESFDGWIDEFRFSKGAYRWNDDFVIPTEAYSVPDANPPDVIIDSPANSTYNTNFNATVTATDGVQVDDCWVTVNGGTSNVSMFNTSTTPSAYNYSAPAPYSDGGYLAEFYCNDTNGNINDSESISFTMDFTNPQIEIQFPATNRTNSTLYDYNVNYTISDTNLGDCWWSDDDGASNTTIVGCALNISGAWADGETNVIIWVNDTAGNVNRTSITFFIDGLIPVFDFVTQTPTDMMWNSTGNFELLFNVTDTVAGINLSSIVFFHGVNHSHDGIAHWNWSFRYPESIKQTDGRRAGNRNESSWWEEIVWKTLPEDIWSLSGHDTTSDIPLRVLDSGALFQYINFTSEGVHTLFPSMWFLDKSEMLAENKTDQFIDIYKRHPAKINLNVTNHDLSENFTTYLHFNIETQGATYDLITYMCNSTYTTGKPSDSPNCQSGQRITGTDTRDVVMYNSSYFHLYGGGLDGMFGAVTVTRSMQIVLATGEPTIANSYKLFYANNSLADNTDFNDSGVLTTSTNDASAWTTVSGTPDFWYATSVGEHDTVSYYVYACDNFGNCGNSTWQTDLLEVEPNKPPYSPTITSPEDDDGTSIPFYINWTTAGDSDGDDYNASVYLYNPDGSINTTLADNNITDDNPYFFVNDTSIPDGVYRINITLCDIYGDCSSATPIWNFTVDNTFPQIEWGDLTAVDGTTYDLTNIFANVTASDLNERNITFGIFNSTHGALNISVLEDGTRSMNWTTLSYGVHYINVSIIDEAENFNSTDTRRIILGYTGTAYPTSSSGGDDYTAYEIGKLVVDYPFSVVYGQKFNVTLKMYNEDGELFDALLGNIDIKSPFTENITIGEYPLVKLGVGEYSQQFIVSSNVDTLQTYKMHFSANVRGIDNTEVKDIFIYVSENNLSGFQFAIIRWFDKFQQNPALFTGLAVAILFLTMILFRSKKNLIVLKEGKKWKK